MNERSIRLYLALKQIVEREKFDFLHHSIVSLAWRMITLPLALRKA